MPFNEDRVTVERNLKRVRRCCAAGIQNRRAEPVDRPAEVGGCQDLEQGKVALADAQGLDRLLDLCRRQRRETLADAPTVHRVGGFADGRREVVDANGRPPAVFDEGVLGDRVAGGAHVAVMLRRLFGHADFDPALWQRVIPWSLGQIQFLDERGVFGDGTVEVGGLVVLVRREHLDQRLDDTDRRLPGLQKIRSQMFQAGAGEGSPARVGGRRRNDHRQADRFIGRRPPQRRHHALGGVVVAHVERHRDALRRLQPPGQRQNRLVGDGQLLGRCQRAQAGRDVDLL